MNALSWIQLLFYLIILLALAKPLGTYMARVYQGEPVFLDPVLGPVERLLYRLCGVKPEEDMDWKVYAFAVMLFNGLGLLAVYGLQRLQGMLPLDPQGFGAVSPDSSWNTAVSFATNTNWQSYAGEGTLSYLSQMAALAWHNFTSAAVGLAVAVALARGLTRRLGPEVQRTLGNFWVDLTRGTLYVLLPLSVLLAVILAAQGVVQSFAPYQQASLVEPMVISDQAVTEQTLPLGPVASQVAIKQLGTNGGGYFGANSAHPFENPTPATNFLEMLAILLIPAALCYTFGSMVKDQRQGWALLAAMLVIFVPSVLGTYAAEQAGNPRFDALGVDQAASSTQSGGNMEGKETRFGIAGSVLWATATTAASNGSVNAMHDSFTPLGGLLPMWLMQLGEVVFGGVGSGLYGMLMFAVIAVFVAGLMVGRTPEYLGKKIEAYEVKMAAIVLLVPSATVLIGTAVAVTLPAATGSVANPGMHGFSQILYAFSSAGNNNGSAFAGLSANTPFYNLALGVAMWVSRYWLMLPVLAIAGSLARKRASAVTAGTLPTHTPLFVTLLVTTVLLVGALTFLPALALGPIVEHLQLYGEPLK